MKIIRSAENDDKLIGLWMRVFGDEREYIELLFPDEENYCDIFALFDNGSICSALYLLDCTLKFNGSQYKGKYLYAAATDENYRGRGLMSLLIKEAQDFCKNEGLDFIALVPADDGLYNYYEKFGFVSAMHRVTEFSFSDMASVKEEIGAEEYFSQRGQRLDNCISFSGNSLRYVALCLGYTGLKFYKNNNGDIFVTEKNSCLYDEFITDDTAVRFVVDNEARNNNSIIEKFGMLYPICNELKIDWKFTDLYMNIALD